MVNGESKNKLHQGGGDVADDQLILLVPLGESRVGSGGSSDSRGVVELRGNSGRMDSDSEGSRRGWVGAINKFP